jgi:hypothetical protein
VEEEKGRRWEKWKSRREEGGEVEKEEDIRWRRGTRREKFEMIRREFFLRIFQI